MTISRVKRQHEKEFAESMNGPFLVSTIDTSLKNTAGAAV